MARHRCQRSADNRMLASLFGGHWHPKFGQMLENSASYIPSRKKRGKLKLKKRRQR